ncbi:MAG: DUF4926 domain-containing protein [Rhizobacter sp.]|nr:DUF4926 domain-containing protein [Chlorobiales bacterium]
MIETNEKIEMLDVVALTERVTAMDFNTGEQVTLNRGLVGAVVECYDDGESFEVEFVDGDGQTVAMIPVKKTSLLKLSYAPTLV